MATDIEKTDDYLDDSSALIDGEEETLKNRVLVLARRITGLSNTPERLEDPIFSQEVSHSIKPYIDRLVTLKNLLNPVDRIISKREQIEELQAGIAADVAEVETLSDTATAEVDDNLINDLQGEISAVKKDRKIFVSEIDAEDEVPFPKAATKGGGALLDLTVVQRLEKIFGNRFIGQQQLASLLGISFSSEDQKLYNRLLEHLWKQIFTTNELRPHVERNRLKTLQNTFRDYALILRHPQLPKHPGADTLAPCSIESLRQHFEEYFINTSERSLWYTKLDFYRDYIDKGHWALVDRQYLNCTFKRPGIRLLMYARANDLPPRMVRQKSAVEDIYDRVILETELKERFFDNCNSITRSQYRQGREGSTKWVYIYHKDNDIRISGKPGIPHWRPSKPRWPGVLPSIVFAS